ncbi:uncharacterized protein [Montipora capricornis]|uniref:uncharacterized protein n=1 Tax=Montipora capricornis TaxID=246305 RepID=UPI0035F13803
MASVSSYPNAESLPDVSLLSFPEKLWWIVNNPKCHEINWNAQGTTIVIPSNQRFVAEILNNPSSALFKTKNFASFVRQLNLYGFRKITEYPRRTASSVLSSASRCEFKHAFFRKGRRDLLLHVKRQIYSKKTGERQPLNRNQASKEKPFDATNHCLSSVNTTWNRPLYTAVPFVPWQTQLQMPFTLFAPFCTPYQLAQLPQGPMPGSQSLQGVESQGRLEPFSADSTLAGTRSSGDCGEAERPRLSSSDTLSPGDQRFLESLPVKANESGNNLLSPSSMNSTETTIEDTASRAPVTSSEALAHSKLTTNYTTGDQDNVEALTTESKERGNGQSLSRESAENYSAGARPSHALNEEHIESIVSGSKQSVLKDVPEIDIPDFCQAKGFASVRLE